MILIHKVPDKIFNASTCGDNCAKWILNTNQIVHSMEELVPIAGMIVR